MPRPPLQSETARQQDRATLLRILRRYENRSNPTAEDNEVKNHLAEAVAILIRQGNGSENAA